MDILQNIELFKELAQCGSEIYTWCYSAGGVLLSSNCPEESIFNAAFSLFGCLEQMLEHGKKHHLPISLGAPTGLVWYATFEKESTTLLRCWVIGPVLYQHIPEKAIEDGFRQYTGIEISLAWKKKMIEATRNLTVTPSHMMGRYALMLHYCLTGERLLLSDLNAEVTIPRLPASPPPHDRHLVWMAEKGMLQMVRNGDLNYKEALSASMLLSSGVPLSSPEALRQGKTSLVVFISLVCRAAMEGGLSPEEAYALGDSYIQTTESSKSLSELNSIAPMMYDDFIRRVHKCRQNPKLSSHIQKCCDYIEMHLEQNIRAKDLAIYAGYTEYYLTRKFKEETGLSLNGYIRRARVERAKVLLKSTDLSVQEIADRLSFCTRNYFSRVFLEETGMTPAQYRSSPDS